MTAAVFSANVPSSELPVDSTITTPLSKKELAQRIARIRILKKEEEIVAEVKALAAQSDRIKIIQALKTQAQQIAVIKVLGQAEQSAALRALDKRRYWLNREFPIYVFLSLLTVALGLTLFFFSPAGLPALALMGIAFAANYIGHSRHWKITLGRGVAVVMSLLIACLAISSMLSIGVVPLPAIIVIALGCFGANLVLYRYDVPKAIDDISKVGKTTPDNENDSKAVTRFKAVWRIASFVLSLVAGLVLTLAMGSSVYALGGALASWYIFAPLMVIAYTANATFVYRGLKSVRDFILNSAWSYSNGVSIKTANARMIITPLKNRLSENPDSEYVSGGYRAVLSYYLGIHWSATPWKKLLKPILLVMLTGGLAILIAIVSQKALIDVNMLHFAEAASYLPAATFVIFFGILTHLGYVTRMSFSAIRLSLALNYILGKASDLIVTPIHKAINFFKGYRSLKTTDAVPEQHKESRFSAWKKNYTWLLKRQVVDSDNIDFWQQVYGKEDWERHLNEYCDTEWEYIQKNKFVECRRLAYYHVRACVLILGESLGSLVAWLSIVLNSFANGSITMAKPDDPSVAILGGAVSRCASNALTSGALTLNSKRKREEELQKKEKQWISTAIPEASTAVSPLRVQALSVETSADLTDPSAFLGSPSAKRSPMDEVKAVSTSPNSVVKSKKVESEEIVARRANSAGNLIDFKALKEFATARYPAPIQRSPSTNDTMRKNALTAILEAEAEEEDPLLEKAEELEIPVSLKRPITFFGEDLNKAGARPDDGSIFFPDVSCP